MINSDEVARYWENNAEDWTRQSRAGCDVYRDALNTPAFLAILPDIKGLTGLDIGCGEGTNTRRLAQSGAKMNAIDVAPTFIRYAKQTETEKPLGIDFQIADARALPFSDNHFDFATAFMSLMDMSDQQKVLDEAYRILKPGGFFQFSILHPCFAPPYRKVVRDENRNVLAVEVAEYFNDPEGRVDSWWFSTLSKAEREKVAPFRVPYFHRTLSSWVEMICRTGFIIQQFGEPSASEELAKAEPIVADTRVAPLFLHIRAVKPVNIEL